MDEFEEEMLLDTSTRQQAMVTVLNKKKISKYELDSLFAKI